MLDKDNEEAFLHISILPVLIDKDKGGTFPHFHTSELLDRDISCGYTTDFYLGKADLPRANSSKICLGKFISGFVLPR